MIFINMNYRDFFKEDLMPGGKGDETSPQTVDHKQLSMGIKVEMEHTNDAKKAREIAMDHLTEDPQYYSKLQQAGLADELGGNNKGIKEIDVDPSNNQTSPGTTYPKVDSDPSKGPDMAGGIDKTAVMKSKETSDVDSTPKDPTPTDHITGGMGSTPVNQQILSKGGCGGDISQSGVATSKVATFDMLKAIGNKGMGGVAKDISIDIAEGKKLLTKMIKESLLGKEGYGGDPATDTAYVPKKRWTVKWNENHQDMGDYRSEVALQTIKTIVNKSTGDVDNDMMSIKTYLEDKGVNMRDDDLERMYREEMDKVGKQFDYTFGRDDGYSDKTV